jgi:hypothetical protein
MARPADDGGQVEDAAPASAQRCPRYPATLRCPVAAGGVRVHERFAGLESRRRHAPGPNTAGPSTALAFA